ncbi:MAG: tyrosine-type recombinase/integrase [Rhodospirillaceae bacterium]|nr:tyrosine-type recombinase/integrase [Rhodospirillaceae bacterium]
MTLQEAINRYIEWQRSHGAKFETSAEMLHRFARGIGVEIDCDAVTRSQVHDYLAGNGPLTRYRENKYGALAGFYRYAISRGYASSSPLPLSDNEPKPPRSQPPYIYSREELCRIFSAIEGSRTYAWQLDEPTLHMLLVLLYGAALRGGEARSLTVDDVDLSAAVLTVRNTKFYKNRLVPVGPQLAARLRRYAELRADRPFVQGPASTFLTNLDGTPLRKPTVYQAFVSLLRRAGIEPTNDSRQAPCLHGLRHSFAVHRLTDWYRQGADVQRLLPALSTYLGHAELRHTQVYLSMTPELLHQAALRFERYAGGDNNE